MAENVDPETLGRVTENEIESQPLCWQKAHRQGLEDPVGLPHTGERVLVLGCGTSYYLAAAYAWLREQAGHGATDALVASELPPRLRAYDRVVAISRSGSTVEVLQALSKLPAGMPTTGILGGLDTPVASAVTQVVDVSYADERSVVQTRFPTTVLTLLRTHIGASSDEISELIRRAEAVVREPVTTPGPRQLVVLATGWGAFLAEEAALKCRESAGMWAEAYAIGEYRHGPISVAGPDTLVWALSPTSAALRDAITGTGAKLREQPDDPQIGLVVMQRHALAWARSSGRDPDLPVHLTRSVVSP